VVDENEVAFVDIDAPIVNGKPSSIRSFEGRSEFPMNCCKHPKELGS